MSKFWKALISFLLPQLAGGLGALATFTSVRDWYPRLNKPFFNPPSWLFGPVWTVLYLLMGLAIYLVWITDHPLKKPALTLFWVQLTLNAIWSPAFFGLQSPLLGLGVIVPLWIVILACIRIFYPIRNVSAYLMIPYLIWVSFATVLNAAIWYLN